MRLYFLRHGIAEDARPGQADVERELTPEGVEEMRKIARALKRLGVEPDMIMTSPAVRAAATAFIAAEGLFGDSAARRLAEDPGLSPGCRLGDLEEILHTGHPKCASLMLVGHEPDFSTLIGQLTGGSEVVMKKAGLARLDVDPARPGEGVLEWLLPPKVLRALGE